MLQKDSYGKFCTDLFVQSMRLTNEFCKIAG